jgi:hypothetical protein
MPISHLRSDATTAGLLHLHAREDKKRMQQCKGCSKCTVIALKALVFTLLAPPFIIHSALRFFADGPSKPKEKIR